jgi:predicted transcriptional regulator
MRRRIGTDWIELARALWEMGQDLEVIAAACDVSVATVGNYSRRLGWDEQRRRLNRYLTRYPWATYAQLRYEAGVLLREIGEELGIAENTMRDHAKRGTWDTEAHAAARAQMIEPDEGHRLCRGCGEVKPVEDFHAGYTRCKGCVAQRPSRSKRYRREERRRAAERVGRDYRTLEQVQADRAAREQLRRAERERRHEARRMTPDRQREYWRRYQRLRRRMHVRRSQARRAVQRAVESGRITKPAACQRCDSPTPAAALHGHHHRGYDPAHHLDVRWLCVGCHVEAEGAWGGQLHGAARR